jgi:hypothetical protein
MLTGRFIATAGMIACVAVTLSAQWRVTTKRVPLTPDGKPNYAAPTPKMPDGMTPDLSGIWDVEKQPCTQATIECLEPPPVGFISIATGAPEEPPMQPWAEALVKQHRENSQIDDPNLRCLPHAPPRMWGNFVMQKLIQTPDTLTILDEFMGQYREIFLDGRPLPNDPEPTFKGYSVGRWQGDALVVDTIGIKGNWFDVQGHPLTEQARIIERIRRVSYGNLEVEVTVDDPKAYTKPWTRTLKLLLALNTELFEFICNENEKDLQLILDAAKAK